MTPPGFGPTVVFVNAATRTRNAVMSTAEQIFEEDFEQVRTALAGVRDMDSAQFLAVALWALDQAGDDVSREQLEQVAGSKARRIFDRLE